MSPVLKSQYQSSPGSKLRIMRWPVDLKCALACCEGEVSQHPICPHCAQRRRCTHQPPTASHSTQPVPLGGTAGSTACISVIDPPHRLPSRKREYHAGNSSNEPSTTPAPAASNSVAPNEPVGTPIPCTPAVTAAFMSAGVSPT